MNIYKENKNFVNKFVQALKVSSKTGGSVSTSLSIFFNSSRSFYMNLESKIDDIVIEEAGKRLYFGVLLKESGRLVKGIDISTSNSTGIKDAALKMWVSDNVNVYNMNANDLSAIKKFLKSKNIEYVNGNKWETLDDRTFCSNLREDYKVLDGYSDVSEFESSFKSLAEVDIDIKLHPDVFKSLKNRKIIPVAYINDVDNDINYVGNRARSRKSTSIFYSCSLTGVDCIKSKSIQDMANSALRYVPYNYWVFYDMDFNGLDRRSYLRYNFDL